MNVKPREYSLLSDGMLAATFLTTLFYSSTYPYIHKEIMAVTPSKIVALSQIINCVSVIAFGALWNKRSERLFRLYPFFCVFETFCGVCSSAFAILTGNIVAYFLLDTLIFAIVTRNICCGGVKLKAIRYNAEKQREHFDNNNNSAASAATIIGSVVSMLLQFDFHTMLCIATVGNAIDNIFYLFIFKKTTER